MNTGLVGSELTCGYELFFRWTWLRLTQIDGAEQQSRIYVRRISLHQFLRVHPRIGKMVLRQTQLHQAPKN